MKLAVFFQRSGVYRLSGMGDAIIAICNYANIRICSSDDMYASFALFLICGAILSMLIIVYAHKCLFAQLSMHFCLHIFIGVLLSLHVFVDPPINLRFESPLQFWLCTIEINYLHSIVFLGKVIGIFQIVPSGIFIFLHSKAPNQQEKTNSSVIEFSLD